VRYWSCGRAGELHVRRQEVEAMEWSCLKEHDLWGDYGHVLVSGSYDLDMDGRLLLDRAGPFLPPVSFPHGRTGIRVVVSDDFRRSLLAAGYSELVFREAIKARIVKLNWHTWDRSAGAPRRSPRGGEPENYMEGKPHDHDAVERMPLAWELVPPLVHLDYEENPELQDEEDPPLRAILSQREYPRWFRSREEWGEQILSPAVRDWLAQAVGEWVSFELLHWRFAEPAAAPDPAT
jgi:hypothetical protein